jgi:phosphoglycerol geranylgeranyltransferase
VILVIPLQVWEYLSSKLNKEKVHLTLIDPNNQPPAAAGEMAKQAAAALTDGIMVGGSTGVSKEVFDETITAIKQEISLPVIIFPTNINSLSQNADAVFFMSLLNSKNIKYITREQRYGARFVKQTGLESISMGYIVISPGMTVGEVGEAELIEHDNIDDSINYALMAQYFGMKLVYLEAGSGAPVTVPPEMIREVKKNIQIPLVIGGGIRSSAAAKTIAQAGADIIVTGTIVEDTSNIESTLSEIINSIKSIPRAAP